MFKLPKNSYILADKPSNAEDDDDSNEIEEINNSIFFYTGVTKTSILNLNKKLRKLSNDLNYIKHEELNQARLLIEKITRQIAQLRKSINMNN